MHPNDLFYNIILGQCLTVSKRRNSEGYLIFKYKYPVAQIIRKTTINKAVKPKNG